MNISMKRIILFLLVTEKNYPPIRFNNPLSDMKLSYQFGGTSPGCSTMRENTSNRRVGLGGYIIGILEKDYILFPKSL